MPTTPLGGITTPADSDPFADGALAIRTLAAALDTRIIRKSADESVTSSTVLQNDNELAFAVVAGKTYIFDLCLIFSTGASAPDAKVGFSFPTGTMVFGVAASDPATSGPTNVNAGTWNAATVPVSGTTAIAVGVGAAAGAGAMATVRGSFLCTASGTVTLMWAQNTSDANPQVLKAGSFLRAQVIA